MTQSSAPARPPQVTMAGWMTVGASLFMLVNVFTYVSQLRTIENREAVAKTLSRDPLKGMGIDLEQALSMLHGASLVAGACAAATAILGWFALQRNHHARIALSVLVLPLFFTGLVASPFLSSMIAVSVVLLWARPARDWFNGVTPEPPARKPEQPSSSVTPPPPPEEPRAFEGFGQSQPTRPSDPTQPVSMQSMPPFPAARPVRPGELLQACIITWIMSGVVLLGMAIVVIGLLTTPDLLKDVYESDSRFGESGVSVSQLKVASIVMALVFSAWSAVAIVLALFVFNGHNWARITLVVSGSVAGLLSLVLVISSPVLLVVTAACVATVVLLLRPPSTQFCKR
ncbi:MULTISPECIES: hypothetical protein [unclassified Nocardioides]|uniref:hypothetical protein n=1 Tax=unclassified Nocardioides TaxID=2615069 RepID=UPI000AB7024D|nr:MULTISPECIES: hypothetical protein [unclassified Nocardioides]